MSVLGFGAFDSIGLRSFLRRGTVIELAELVFRDFRYWLKWSGVLVDRMASGPAPRRSLNRRLVFDSKKTKSESYFRKPNML